MFLSPRWIFIGAAVAVLCTGVLVWALLFKEAPETIFPEVVVPDLPSVQHQVIGQSVEGRTIDAYTYGDGETHLLFVGGIHGGYEWNSVLLAYAAMDYLEAGLETLPDNIQVTIIPVLNPDGLAAVTGTTGRFEPSDVAENTVPGRFNANAVDLNRNFDCKWQPESAWRGERVSAGTAPFSEPEARALRDFVQDTTPEAAVFWHSQSDAVYASECMEGVLPETLTIMQTYADAAGYPAVESFDFYEITGDAEGWLASIGIPAITVELATHETIEWTKNRAGIDAVLEYYGR